MGNHESGLAFSTPRDCSESAPLSSGAQSRNTLFPQRGHNVNGVLTRRLESVGDCSRLSTLDELGVLAQHARCVSGGLGHPALFAAGKFHVIHHEV